jgi:hypothetical protein
MKRRCFCVECLYIGNTVVSHSVATVLNVTRDASFRAGQEELAFTPNFGCISSAQDSRQLQFTARFVF